MKTEPTEEMREKIERLFEFTDEDIHQIEKLQLAKKYFVAGYNEAMRWRDPDVELPVDSCDVLVKTAEDRYYACYFCLEREDFFHGYYRLQGVIGWRPIE